MHTYSGALLRNKKLTHVLTVEVPRRSIEPGIIPLLQTLGVEDNHQWSILLAREGQEEIFQQYVAT